jgi:putative lipase involved disintegration of autophagic bodies
MGMYKVLDDHQCCCACHYGWPPLCDCYENCVKCVKCDNLEIRKEWIDLHNKECHKSKDEI